MGERQQSESKPLGRQRGESHHLPLVLSKVTSLLGGGGGAQVRVSTWTQILQPGIIHDFYLFLLAKFWTARWNRSRLFLGHPFGSSHITIPYNWKMNTVWS
jgi:hypothetical protein